MVTDAKQFELDRILSMVKTKGYQITSSSIQGDMVVVQAEKSFTPETATTRDLEATWITNFLKSFGWVLDSMGFPPNKVSIQFSKTVKVAPA